MRPNDTVFYGAADLPETYAALVRQLRDGGSQAPPHLLTAVASLQELVLVGRSTLAGRQAPYSADRKSLGVDIARGIANVGPHLRLTFSAPIEDFQRDVQRLNDLLADAGGTRVALGAAEALLGLLATPRASDAAWQDCVDAFVQGETTGTCELRIAQLKAILELRGHDWSDRSRRLQGVLNDSFFDLKAAGAELPAEPESAHERAGLDLEDRLDFCRAVVQEEPPTGAITVWLAFANAALPNFYVRHSTIEFIDGRVWPDVRRGMWAGAPADWERPPELDDSFADIFLSSLPESDFVLVRIVLENAPISRARERARELVSGLTELANIASGWRLMSGEAAFVEGGGWFGSMGFVDPAESAVRVSLPRFDPTGKSLQDIDEHLVAAYIEGDEVAQDLVGEVRWRAATNRIPDPGQRLALAVRGLERLLAPAAAGMADETKWYGSANRYLRHQWCFLRVSEEIGDATLHGVFALRQHHHDVGSDFGQFDRRLVRHVENGFRVQGEAAIREADLLADQLPTGSVQERMVRELASRTIDGRAASAWIRSLEDEFERLLARTRRQRNGVIHGTPTVPAVIASVDRFVSVLAFLLIEAAFEAVLSNRSLITQLQTIRTDCLTLISRLEAGEEPAIVLGRPERDAFGTGA